MADRRQHGRFSRRRGKILRAATEHLRHACRETARLQCSCGSADALEECAKTPELTNAETNGPKQLDGWAAMLQAIFISKEIPMLEPWIIDEIRRREEERRRGDRPQLELPVPEPHWPIDIDTDHGHGDKTPERGVVIIGM